MCDPSLLDRTRPGQLSAPTTRQKKVKQGEVCRAVQDELHTWRVHVKRRDFPHALFGFEALLSNDLLSLLSSIGPVETRADLSAMLSGHWAWETRYGDELHSKMLSINIPPMVPLPTKSRPAGVKRKQTDATGDVGEVMVGTEKPVKKAKATLSPSAQNLMEHTFSIPAYYQAGPHSQAPMFLQFHSSPSKTSNPTAIWAQNLVPTKNLTKSITGILDTIDP